MDERAATVLQRLDELVPTMVQDVRDLVRIPSVGGTDAENEAQAAMARRFERGGLDVDHWRIDLDAITSHPDFPGVEVERREAWGVVGRLPGTTAASVRSPCCSAAGRPMPA